MAEGKLQTLDWKSVRRRVHPRGSCFREFIYFFLFGRIAVLTARLDLHRAQQINNDNKKNSDNKKRNNNYHHHHHRYFYYYYYDYYYEYEYNYTTTTTDNYITATAAVTTDNADACNNNTPWCRPTWWLELSRAAGWADQVVRSLFGWVVVIQVQRSSLRYTRSPSPWPAVTDAVGQSLNIMHIAVHKQFIRWLKHEQVAFEISKYHANWSFTIYIPDVDKKVGQPFCCQPVSEMPLCQADYLLLFLLLCFSCSSLLLPAFSHIYC